MSSEERGIGKAAAREEALPSAALPALEHLESRGETLGITRQSSALEIGVVFAGARQAELQEPTEGRREHEEEQSEPGDVHPRRDKSWNTDDANNRHETCQAAEHVGKRHHLGVARPDVGDLMRKDSRYLPGRHRS